MKKDSGPDELEQSGLLEYEREREETEKERQAVHRIDVVAARTYRKAALAHRLLMGCLALAMILSLGMAAAILHVRASERSVMERLERIENGIPRGISVRVEHVETGVFASGSAICAPVAGKPDPCKQLCRSPTSSDASNHLACSSLASVADAYRDAAVVFVTGGHDRQELTASMNRSFEGNGNVAMTRARMVQDIFRDALAKSRSQHPDLHHPNTLFIASSRGAQHATHDCPQDRTVRLAIVRTGELPR